MQSIRDIIDSTLTLGFSYFYGMGDDQGYLRRMLHTNPSLESIQATLKDDIQFIKKEVDEDYFRYKYQTKTFKKLKKYLEEAKKYISERLKQKTQGSKWEQKQIEKEIRALDKDLRNGLIEKEEYDYAIKMLLKPTADDLEEVKSKFENIDAQVKLELKSVGFEEESLNEDEFEEEEEYPELSLENESYKPNEDKTLFENLTQDMKTKARELLNSLTGKKDWELSAKKWGNPFGGPDRVTVYIKNWDYVKYVRVMKELKKLALKAGFRFDFGGDVYSYDSRTGAEDEAWFSKENYTPDINKLVDEDNRRYTMEEFNDICEDMEQVNEANLNPAQQSAQQQKQALALSTMVKNYETQKKTGKMTPQQIAANKKNNAAKLQQLGVDPKLIIQLQQDDKI